jgi:hypothetical protein
MIHVHISQSDVPRPQSSQLATGIVANVGGQSNATPLTARKNVVSNCVAGAGVALVHLPVPDETVLNRCGTGQQLLVYPPTGEQIEGHAENAAVGIADGGNATFTFDGVMTWLIT